MIFSQLIEKEYLFQVYQLNQANYIPEGIYLFNTNQYLQNQLQNTIFSFSLQNMRLKHSECLLHVSIKDTLAVSPVKATFGGIEIHQGLSDSLLDLFIQHVDQFLYSQNIHQVKLTNYPFAYNLSAAQKITAALLRNGYTIDNSEVNYHIPVTNEPLEKRMHYSEKRRLRKCIQSGMTFKEEKSPDLSKIHTFIHQARIRKGFPMTLPLETFRNLFMQMPNVYRVFVAIYRDELAALTVTVRINKDILYNFYPADNEYFLNYSPSVFITSEVYKIAQQEGYKMVDLGIATDQSVPNYGLMRFKSNLGAENSLRLSFCKRFNDNATSL
ncbi:GNAT family N-acetyltransferase [Xanthocytophaga flava]|uniref:GNAT family N-acetyltransferase n=1 Tax=Xanthocytophaga flava TaxID=3048013 RepID=UPI0028D7A459|nr:GNAT family N-acetyltransferase [Xanthocytophaga flavus]